MDRQLNDVYTCKLDFSIEDIIFNTHDVSAVKLVSLEEFEAMIKDITGEIVPAYREQRAQIIALIRQFIRKDSARSFRMQKDSFRAQG